MVVMNVVQHLIQYLYVVVYRMSVMMCSVCAHPLSSYPTAKLFGQLKGDQWFKLGYHLNLTDEELESLKKSPHPTAATLLVVRTLVYSKLP